MLNNLNYKSHKKYKHLHTNLNGFKNGKRISSIKILNKMYKVLMFKNKYAKNKIKEKTKL